jgi:hypothetical protein
MKYLHDNDFTVLTMANLFYDDASRYLKISNGNDASLQESIPNNQNEYAARIDDVAEKNKPPLRVTVPSDGDNFVEDNSEKSGTELYSKAQSDDDEEEVEESNNEIPSAILQFIENP